MSMFSKAAKKATGALGGIFGGKTRNPYQSVDLSSLDDMSKFDYLKDYAKTAYAPVKAESENLFQDYLKGIQSGYSTEDAQLQNMLRDIGRETENAVGSSKLDYLDRGLGGPGQMSDIEAIGLAQTRGKGQELADSARLGVLSGREKTMADAYGQRYATGTALGTQEASSGIDLNKYLSEIMNQRNLAKATGQLTNAANYASSSQTTPGLFESMLRGFGNSYATSAGSKLGGGK